MMDELGVFQHNMANSSPVIYGEPDLRQHVERPGREPRQRALAEGAGDHRASTRRPASSCGRTTRSGEKILHGQWSSPAVGKIGDTVQVVDRPGRRLGARLRGQDRQEAVGVRHEPEGLGVAEDAQRGHQHAGHLRERRLHRQRPGSRARRGRRAPLRDRPDQDAATSPKSGRIWHYDKIRRSISTGADLQRHPLLFGLQRLPACARRQDRQAVLDPRHVRGDLGIADGHRRQGLSRRRGRRRHGPQRRQDDEGHRREQHGQLGLLHAGAGQRRALHRQSQRALRARGRRSATAAK